MPIPLSIKNEVALIVVHESVDEEPLLTVAGLAERVQTGAGGGGVAVTTIVAVHVTEPPAPVAVPVYVVVAVGDTGFEPDATGVTAPMPWLIENDAALDVVQESKEEFPV